MQYGTLRGALVRKLTRVALLGAALGWSMSSHAVVNLFEYLLNTDGVSACAFGPCDFSDLDSASGDFGSGIGDLDAALAEVTIDTSGFDFAGFSGLGNIVLEVTGPGAHNVHLFVDHDIDFEFADEDGFATGTAAAGQTWEIDEPFESTVQDAIDQFDDSDLGFPYAGDIYANTLDSNPLDSFLDEGIDLFGTDRGAFVNNFDATYGLAPEDTSLALGWNFDLAADETATVEFLVSLVMPDAGAFFLTQTDGDGGDPIYFSASLVIEAPPPDPDPVPEPGALLLLGSGLLAMTLRRRRLTLSD